MKALIIGGTGTISSAVTRQLVKDPNWEVKLLNRGRRKTDTPSCVDTIVCDIDDEQAVKKALNGEMFDTVVEFNGYIPSQVERDVRLFSGVTRQYVYISSACIYQTPPSQPFMTEGMLQNNPFWQYALDKIECEKTLYRALREDGFPLTIVRPSHTYCENAIPFCLEADGGSWPVIKRIIDEKPVIIPGDGSSLWTITFNSDFAKGLVGIMGNDHTIGEAFHITTDESITWTQMAQTVADALNKPLKPYYIPTDVLVAIKPDLGGGLNGDKRHSVVYDNSKIKHFVPGFHADVTFKMGVERALKKILAAPELMKDDPEFDRWCDTLIKTYDEALNRAKDKLATTSDNRA